MDNPFEPLIGIGLCYGTGNLDRGLENGIARLRYAYGRKEKQNSRILEHAAYVEIESVAAWNLVKKMEAGLLDPRPVFSDLKKFPFADFHNKIHFITGGYPCQPFSQAGLQNGVEDPRHLFPSIECGMDATRPVFAFFENVANHLNIGFDEVRRRLSRIGYKVEADIFAASQVGAPHLRKRLFILAVADAYCTEQSKRRGDFAEVLGLQKSQRQPELSAIVSGGDSKKLGHTSGADIQRNGSCDGGFEIQDRGSSGEVGNSDNQRQQQCGGDIGEIRRRSDDSGQNVEDSEIIGSGGRSDGDSGGRGRSLQTQGSGASLDNSVQPGLEGHYRNVSAKKRWEDAVGSIASSSIWPKGQGPDQHQWEEPRLESSLGFTVDGFDFTEDLLRMAGNAVVPQQAELATVMLFQKFL